MPNLFEEKKYLFNSERVMIGVDEVGRGCWAGPVLSCASYIYPSQFKNLPKINDSKKLSKKHRREIFLSPSLNENTSDIGLVSSSAKNDPIFSLISNDGVSRGSAPNLIKTFSIADKSFFLRRSFLSQRSSNPEGNPGINFFSLFIFWYPG